MKCRKNMCVKWTLVIVIIVCPLVCSRPQESTATVVTTTLSSEENDRSQSLTTPDQTPQKEENTISLQTTENKPRDVRTKTPVIGESIKAVASQLLDNKSNKSEEVLVGDTRIPPKLKQKLNHVHKIKTRQEDDTEPNEKGHAGIAVPVTMDELETEAMSETSTSSEGISTWVLLSNPQNITQSTEPTKIDEPLKKQKPIVSKNKTKRPQINKLSSKRPIIGSTNKSDLVASGSAINEKVLNKIKDTVMSNVQKHKNSNIQKPTTSTMSSSVLTEAPATVQKNEPNKSQTTILTTSKPLKSKKKNKNKSKTTTTLAPITINESALLPMEPKEQEIELEISTPATTTKKPKRSTTRKKNKTKKRKTSKPKQEVTASATEVKVSNKTKTHKTSKKPSITSIAAPITSQIYSYLSREVMPSVGVGVLGLASLVGIASYFFYPFSTPVRRTLEVDKKDDLYKFNAEEYANDGNGQAEEEMLGTVLAGMPAHSKQKLNPYAGQTTQINRYPTTKEQDIRYRHVASKYEPNYNVHYPQQKTGLAHGAMYPDSINYNRPSYETRNTYPADTKYTYKDTPSSYGPYPSIEPIYAAPQTAPSAVSSYGNDASSSVVYGVKPSSESDFKPVYPFENKFYGETTTSSATYPPTSMFLGSNNETEDPEETKYDNDPDENNVEDENKFVVGNVPKDISETATPAVVPEHGPRNLSRKKRAQIIKRSIVNSIEEALKAAEGNRTEMFMSNEIDGSVSLPPKSMMESIIQLASNISEASTTLKNKDTEPLDSTTINTLSSDSSITSTDQSKIVESISTQPIDNNQKPLQQTTESQMPNELDTTTKSFKVYEVFTSNNDKPIENETNSTAIKNETSVDVNTIDAKLDITTETKQESTSTSSPLLSTETTIKQKPTLIPRPTLHPEVITYPPLNSDGGFFTFLKRLIEFKYRLGLSILQTTSENLNRYLRSMENTVRKVAKASK